MDIEFSLALPREAIGIPMVRRVLGDSLRSLHVTENCVSDILLAVSEACGNAVRYGGPANRYQVEAAIGYGRCDVRIIDKGRGLMRMPERYPSPTSRTAAASSSCGPWSTRSSSTSPPARAPRCT
nr:hypothetical protein GCM10020093_067510 [Planobispora longispora]